MKKTALKLTKSQIKDIGKILVLIRYTRNCHELGVHPLRARAVDAEVSLENFFGGEIPDAVYRSAFTS